MPLDVGAVEIDSVAPPAVYPVPTTSLVVVYAVVVASNVAADVYSAILNVFGPPLRALKFCCALKMSTLKLVGMHCVIAIMFFFN